jgi:hypothetical protein
VSHGVELQVIGLRERAEADRLRCVAYRVHEPEGLLAVAMALWPEGGTRDPVASAGQAAGDAVLSVGPVARAKLEQARRREGRCGGRRRERNARNGASAGISPVLYEQRVV